jgi:putative membrane protein
MRRHPSLEPLEEKALLTTMSSLGPGLDVGPALSQSDTQAIQQVATTNNLDMFLTQLALLADGRQAVQQDALTVLNDGRDIDLQLRELADSKGIDVPSDITGADESSGMQVVAAVKSAMFEPTYLIALIQAEVRLATQLQAESTGSQDSDVRQFAQTALPLVQTDLMATVGLLTGTGAGTSGGTAPPTSPSSPTLGGDDLQTLERSYSGTLLEHFLAQLTALETKNSDVQSYAEKLIDDHEQEDVQLARYAIATGTYLPPSIQGQDVQTAEQVLAPLGTTQYDRNYLMTMVQTHTQDIQDNEQTIATTQNPVLRQFAQDDIPTDWLHRAGAEFLLSSPAFSSTGRGLGHRRRF